jgi:DNA-binding NarL/FixJ family response regulator
VSIRVIVADDQAMVRDGLVALLEVAPDIEVVGQAENGEQAVALAGRLRSEVVVMDIRMPVMDGLAATSQILEGGDGGEAPPPRVLVVTTFDLDEYVYEALAAGASGFVLKDASTDELIRAVRVVAAGDALLAPSVTRRLIAEFARRRPTLRATPGALAALTPRELEVLALIAGGLSNAEIAAQLVVAEQTVKTHVGRILGKLGLRDRAQAVVVAYETGLVRASS